MLAKPLPLFTRRLILRAGLAGLCGAFFPGALLAGAQPLPPVEAAKRQGEFDEMVPAIGAWLASRLGQNEARACARLASARFAALLPTLPDIGKDNRNQDNLYQAGWVVALSQAYKEHGLIGADAGRTLYDLCEQSLAATPKDALLRQGEAYFSPQSYAALRRWAANTQKRRYPGDWVATVVFGNGDDFDVGHNYSECGALKLFRAHGQADAAPYFCLNDFLFSRSEGTGLSRGHTLAQGDPLCDFRYKRGRAVTQCWETETPRFPGPATAGKADGRG